MIGEFMLAACDAWGYDGRFCESVADAQAVLADWTPDCVIADLMMLPQDGTSLIAWVKERFGKQIRTVLYSARQERDTMGVVAGVSHPDAYLSKPFEIDDLQAVIVGGKS